jgi:RNA polymerase sigma factor (sigma-70 family)
MTLEISQARHELLEAFLQCKSYLKQLVRGVVRSRDVEDIVQETFLRSYEASSKAEIQHPHAFMAKTATNLALNWASRAESRLTDPLGDFPDSTVFSTKASVEDGVALEQELLLFARATQQMPPQCRRAFILKKVYGFRRREIAKYMSISEKTVQNHIAKGTLICAEYMDKHNLSVSNGLRSGAKKRHG